jgi:hypothetical protein
MVKQSKVVKRGRIWEVFATEGYSNLQLRAASKGFGSRSFAPKTQRRRL